MNFCVSVVKALPANLNASIDRFAAPSRSRVECASLFRCVLVTQRLEPSIFAQPIPDRIDLEQWNRETVRDAEQMIDQAKCFISFPGQCINLRQRGSAPRPIKCVLRFG